MESTKGVLSHLSALEQWAIGRKVQPLQRSRVEELQARVEALTAQRDRLKAEIHTLKDIVKRKERQINQCTEEEETGVNDSENEQLLKLLARQMQLKELLHAHHIIGGYDIIETQSRDCVCVTLTTAYNGVYLDTYNLELKVKPTLKIIRHNVPPFIALSDLARQADIRDDLRGFLDELSMHLNAFVGRRQQLSLVKELHPWAVVMESNMLCSLLVLMLRIPGKKAELLCTLKYMDHTRCLPTEVHFDCEDEKIPESPEWKNNLKLLMEMPVHRVLDTMKTMSHIG
ncbi:centromere protein O [Corythoichthys intestinalis]|uniref:centromere protein O n=1 Tax=Corythoichthys intestinalis TaxID=161448 RepID=UPI0025A5E718|nr:centromere protein O [Corythoichthys intestinalis]XP_061798218.1 centromere protein O [Nerophis lumbriciformis]